MRKALFAAAFLVALPSLGSAALPERIIPDVDTFIGVQHQQLSADRQVAPLNRVIVLTAAKKKESVKPPPPPRRRPKVSPHK